MVFQGRLLPHVFAMSMQTHSLSRRIRTALELRLDPQPGMNLRSLPLSVFLFHNPLIFCTFLLLVSLHAELKTGRTTMSDPQPPDQ